MGLVRIVGITLCSLPVFQFAVSTEYDLDNAVALLTCIPRTFRAIHWATGAGWDYYKHLHGKNDTDWKALHDHWADVLTRVCRSNGGVYVKAAQMLSTLGAIPDSYRTRLGQLQDKCSPEPFKKIHRTLIHELGERYAEHFTEIDESATAAASIAQVHRAKLASGESVAIKVQYPALHKAIAADLFCLMSLSAISDAIFSGYQLNWIFKNLKQNIQKEMDFLVEARNARCLKTKLQHRQDVRIPEMYEDYCTSRLLVMEWIDGCKLSERSCLRSMGINPRSVALTLLDVFSEMTLIHGFIHGDPHPGNLVVTPTPYDPSSIFSCRLIWRYRPEQRRHYLWRMLSFQWRTPFQLVLLDHGRYLEMDQVTRLDYCHLWCHLIRGDQRSAVEAATRMCHGDSGGHLLPKVLHRTFDKQTRQTIKAETTLSDVIQMFQTAPQTLVDALRIVAAVRHVAAALADIRLDRIYIEGFHAWNGLHEAANRMTWKTEVRVTLKLLWMRVVMWMRDVSYSWQLFKNLHL